MISRFWVNIDQDFPAKAGHLFQATKMATDDHIARVEVIIDYKFCSKDHLQEALTAAGAEGDNHDGNRRLAHVGDISIRYSLSLVAYEVFRSRSQITDLETAIVSISEKASIAERTGISKCIKYSSRQGGRTSKVLALAVSAILGAVRIDSGKPEAAWKVALHLGLVSDSKIKPSEEAEFDPLVHSPIKATTSSMQISLSMIENSDFGDMPPIEPPELPPMNVSDIHDAGTELLDLTMPTFIPGDDEWLHALFISLTGESSSDTASNSLVSDKDATGFSGCNPSCALVEPGNQGNIVDRSRKRKSKGLDLGRERVNPLSKKTRLSNPLILEFLETEAERCSILQYQLADTTYFRTDIQESLSIMGTHADELSIFLLYIASPESILVLKQILEIARKKQTLPMSAALPLAQSKKSRFHSIELLKDESIWCRFLRAVHILELYKSCGGTGVSDGFVVSTAVSVQTQQKQPGNPLHAAEAQVVREMMAEIFPELSPGSKSYLQKEKSMKKIRRFGRRLFILVHSFGPGILGLMMNDDLLGFPVSETTIVNLTDKQFAEFVAILKRSHDNFLPAFASAAQKLLDPVIYNSLPPYPFLIEQNDSVTILKYPKGSKELLEQVA